MSSDNSRAERTDQHPSMDSVGGGGSSRHFHFPGSMFRGGGVGSRNFPSPERARFGGGGGSGSRMFPLTAVTDPKFGLFKHVLCFARIMSTLCPN